MKGFLNYLDAQTCGVFFQFFSVSLVVIMDMILQTFGYFFSDHSYGRIVNSGISKFLTIILAFLIFFKESFACIYK